MADLNTRLNKKSSVCMCVYMCVCVCACVCVLVIFLPYPYKSKIKKNPAQQCIVNFTRLKILFVILQNNLNFEYSFINIEHWVLEEKIIFRFAGLAHKEHRLQKVKKNFT